MGRFLRIAATSRCKSANICSGSSAASNLALPSLQKSLKIHRQSSCTPEGCKRKWAPHPNQTCTHNTHTTTHNHTHKHKHQHTQTHTETHTDTDKHNTTHHNTMQHNTTQRNTTQPNTHTTHTQHTQHTHHRRHTHNTQTPHTHKPDHATPDLSHWECSQCHWECSRCHWEYIPYPSPAQPNPPTWGSLHGRTKHKNLPTKSKGHAVDLYLVPEAICFSLCCLHFDLNPTLRVAGANSEPTFSQVQNMFQMPQIPHSKGRFHIGLWDCPSQVACLCCFLFGEHRRRSTCQQRRGGDAEAEGDPSLEVALRTGSVHFNMTTMMMMMTIMMVVVMMKMLMMMIYVWVYLG